jgi:hypothetical protein
MEESHPRMTVPDAPTKLLLQMSCYGTVTDTVFEHLVVAATHTL